MKFVRTVVSQSLLTASLLVSAAASQAYPAFPVPTAPFDLSVHTGMGADTSTLQWSIAADPTGKTGPNVLSELTYRDVTFTVFNASAELRIYRGWLQGSSIFLDYRTGQGTGGEVQDSDYNGNNRTQEYSRSLSSAKDSTLNSLELGIAHPVQMTASTWLVPAVAFARHQQNMVMTDGQQTVDTYNPSNLGAFRGTLNSTYTSEWTGAWAGMSWEYKTRYHQLALGYKHYWMNYHAEADWNLRSDFAHPKSFEHWAVGGGSKFDVRYALHLSPAFSVNLSWYRLDWGTGTGEDKVYFANGTTGGSQLNEVTLESTGYNLGLQLLF